MPNLLYTHSASAAIGVSCAVCKEDGVKQWGP